MPKEFSFAGGPPWHAERALDRAYRCGVEADVPAARKALEASMQPAPREWIGKRLSVLWVLYHPTRDADVRSLAIWLQEYSLGLVDLPHDLVAFAIDEAVRETAHGFIPSVGEVRIHAKARLAERREQIERLALMEAALADPAATRSRHLRRREQFETAKYAGEHHDR